jgi:hypothetical protein
LRQRRLSAPCEIGLKGGEAAFLRDAKGRDSGERDHQQPDRCDKRGEDRATSYRPRDACPVGFEAGRNIASAVARASCLTMVHPERTVNI